MQFAYSLLRLSAAAMCTSTGIRWPLPHQLHGLALLLLVLLSGCAPLQVHVLNEPVSASSPSTETPGETEQEAEVPGARATETTLVTLVTYLTFLAELAGALVIAVAVVRGLFRYVPHIFRRSSAGDTYTEDIRLQVGKSLALALEFELGADILKTAVAPTLEIIAQLAAIAALRTFLNYFLERELRQAEQRRERQQVVDMTPEGEQGSRVYPADQTG
jgi:uncharacterized membrane protein